VQKCGVLNSHDTDSERENTATNINDNAITKICIHRLTTKQKTEKRNIQLLLSQWISFIIIQENRLLMQILEFEQYLEYLNKIIIVEEEGQIR
jgi:hypothetical protein